MSKVTERAAMAMYYGYYQKNGDTEVSGDTMCLYGHKIAWIDEQGYLHITLAGYNTLITRDRLNGLLKIFGLNIRIYSRKGQAFVYFPDGYQKAIRDKEAVRINEQLFC